MILQSLKFLSHYLLGSLTGWYRIIRFSVTVRDGVLSLFHIRDIGLKSTKSEHSRYTIDTSKYDKMTIVLFWPFTLNILSSLIKLGAILQIQRMIHVIVLYEVRGWLCLNIMQLQNSIVGPTQISTWCGEVEEFLSNLDMKVKRRMSFYMNIWSKSCN